MTTQNITESSNLIQNYSETQISQEIILSWEINFNYFVYARESSLDIIFNTQWDNINWNIFVILYWKWRSSGHIVSNISHSNCHINIFTLCLLQDDNEITIDWDVKLWKNIANTQWHLLEKNIILWKKVKIKATPRLDVYSDNVQATHWVSIDKIDPESLLYIHTRWLSASSAINLMVSGYIKNILNHFWDLSEESKIQMLQDILSHIVLPHD